MPHLPWRSDLNFKILLVEDDDYTLSLMAGVVELKYPAATVLAAGNGKYGLDMYLTHHPDLVVTDVTMSGLDGVRMAEEMLSVRPDLHLFFITAHERSTVEARAVAAGIDNFRYFLKPLDYGELFQGIDECIGVAS